jgi:small subunit ribosomal protein S15
MEEGLSSCLWSPSRILESFPEIRILDAHLPDIYRGARIPAFQIYRTSGLFNLSEMVRISDRKGKCIAVGKTSVSSSELDRLPKGLPVAQVDKLIDWLWKAWKRFHQWNDRSIERFVGMALSKEKKQSVISSFQINPKDTGSPEVQIAILTERINQLGEHFRKFPKDKHSRRGLLLMVSLRRRHLNYLQRVNLTKYQDVITRLGLRK